MKTGLSRSLSALYRAVSAPRRAERGWRIFDIKHGGEGGADYLERRRPAVVVDRLRQRLRQLGGEVTVTAEAQNAPPLVHAALAATP